MSKPRTRRDPKIATAYSGPLIVPGPGRWVSHPGRHCAPGPDNPYDPDVFFPEINASHQQIAQARTICQGCPVMAACGKYAVEQGARIKGIWGGLTEQQRRKVRQQMTADAYVAGLDVSLTEGLPSSIETSLHEEIA